MNQTSLRGMTAVVKLGDASNTVCQIYSVFDTADEMGNKLVAESV